MKKNVLLSFLSISLCTVLLIGCSSDAVTDAMTAGYGESTIIVHEKSENNYTVEASYNVVLTNKTERVMNVVFTEGTILDAQTGQALVRFTPIVPESYGSTSTVQLFSKQSQSYPVVTPLDLYGFNPKRHQKVVISMRYNMEGYRTEAKSEPILVQTVKD